MPSASRPLAVALAAVSCLAAACTGSTGGGGSGAATTGPVVRVEDVAVAEGPHSTVSAVLTFTTSTPVAPTVEVEGGGRSFTVPTEAVSAHEVPIVGLRAETDYEVTVAAPGDGAPAVASFTTGALPPGLPRMEVVAADEDRMQPGLTVFDAIPLAPPGGGPSPGWVLAVDADGEVVWYVETEQPVGDVRLLPNGNFLFEWDNLGAREVDLLGNVVREWAGELVRGRLAEDAHGRRVTGDDPIPVATDSLHHEIGVLPDGDVLALSTELVERPFPGPRCGEDPATFAGSYQLIADVVVEFDPDDGEVLGEWPLADVLDPVRDPARGAVCSFTNPSIVPTFMYTALGDVKDWTHANSVILDEERNALLVSVRHLNAVLALRYEDDADGPAGELLWRLGPGGTLEMEGDGELPYHQHALHLEADGTLLLYDNGNGRPAPAGTPPQSRAVRYEIDDEAGTVRQVWEYGAEVDGEPAFAFFVGDADPLANGNVLVTNGGLTSEASDVSAQLVEVDPADGPRGGDPVWELRVHDDPPDWVVYRAERIESLYSAG